MKATADDNLQQAVLAALPGKHLALWAEVRRQGIEAHPSEVWRCLANCPAARLDLKTGIWSRRG